MNIVDLEIDRRAPSEFLAAMLSVLPVTFSSTFVDQLSTERTYCTTHDAELYVLR